MSMMSAVIYTEEKGPRLNEVDEMSKSQSTTLLRATKSSKPVTATA